MDDGQRHGHERFLFQASSVIKTRPILGTRRCVPQNSVAYVVELQFNSQGGADFQTVTAHLASQTSPQNQFGIVLDGVVISAPSVGSEYSAGIAGGKAEISGSFTQKSATDLANVLSYGALPLSFEVSSVENVSAKLGGDQLQAGIIAGLIGLALVLAYSILYYRGLALVVSLSLVIAGLLTWALIVLLGQSLGLALNLPGIAGAIVFLVVKAHDSDGIALGCEDPLGPFDPLGHFGKAVRIGHGTT